MKLSEFMTEKAALATKSGVMQADDYVLAVDCSENGEGTVEDYAVAAVHVENTGAAISANTTSKTYLYEGVMTMRSGARRTFSVTGQRFKGDTFQDFVCAHKIVYGSGNTVVRPYVYFCIGTGDGEQGKLTINVTNDGSSAAGNAADFAVSMESVGSPTAFKREAK